MKTLDNLYTLIQHPKAFLYSNFNKAVEVSSIKAELLKALS